jgi:hypothetical protein
VPGVGGQGSGVSTPPSLQPCGLTLPPCGVTPRADQREEKPPRMAAAARTAPTTPPPVRPAANAADALLRALDRNPACILDCSETRLVSEQSLRFHSL